MERGLSSLVVKELTNVVQGKWHNIYFDNFFTSKSILCDLEEVGLMELVQQELTGSTFQSN